nr:multicopper oxidase domain-containing protein [Ruegeria sp. R13_0]
MLPLSGTAWAQASPRPLPIIPTTDVTDGIDSRIRLDLRSDTHDFGTGARSATFGINNPYLGPVLRAKQGQTLPFEVTNRTGEVTTLHWHGLHIPGDVDGGPHQEIEPEQAWSPDLPITQAASMNWFHSHMHGKTAQQTYTGLAGVLLIEDDASLSADLPSKYGADDFMLILQDKIFNSSGQMDYVLTGEVFEEGFTGDTLVLNGAIAPVTQSVPQGLVRLRILNACNARFLTLSLQTGPLTVIASDGGFLASAVQTDSILMSPGERYEVLIDTRAADTNALMVSFGEDEGLLGILGSVFGGGGTSIPALILNRRAEVGFTGSLPDRLAILPPANPNSATVTRSFQLNMGGSEELATLAALWGNVCGDGGMGINGQPMNMDRIDERVRKGDTEIWRIASDDQLHPFHIHGCSFRILTQNSAEPPAYAQGWKDMVHVENEWSEVLVRFDHPATDNAPYMYHCHILEHEDCGMMGQFTVG